MDIEILVVGPIQGNCVILSDLERKEAVVVDPGADPEKILSILRGKDLQLKAILITHAHIDHVGAIGEVHDAFPDAKICMHKGDEKLFANIGVQGQMFGQPTRDNPPAITDWIEEGWTYTFAGRPIKALHTPGHAPGHMVFVTKDDDDKQVVICGDVLFHGGIGRTDLWGGSQSQLLESIRDKLFTMDDETIVISGHGPTTTIGEEKRTNPYVGRGGMFSVMD